MDGFAIKGLIETSFVDWPGKMCSVLFLGRCNYRCPYCHNHLLATGPDAYESRPLEDILPRLEALRGWIDGVCVTGGEPTVSPGLQELLEVLKSNGWRIKLDTNGSNPEVVERLLAAKLLDEVSVDVKAPFEPIPYRRNAGAGADPERVRRTLTLLAGSGIPVELRTTVHPALLSLAEVKRLAQTLLDLFGPGAKLKLQNCRVVDVLNPAALTSPPLDREEFDRWRGEVRGVLEAP